MNAVITFNISHTWYHILDNLSYTWLLLWLSCICQPLSPTRLETLGLIKAELALYISCTMLTPWITHSHFCTKQPLSVSKPKTSCPTCCLVQRPLGCKVSLFPPISFYATHECFSHIIAILFIIIIISFPICTHRHAFNIFTPSLLSQQHINSTEIF